MGRAVEAVPPAIQCLEQYRRGEELPQGMAAFGGVAPHQGLEVCEPFDRHGLHAIAPDGAVTPDLTCPYDCGFCDDVRLEGWES